MPADPGLQFLDTNVLVYAFDSSAGAKGLKARQLVSTLSETREACTSVQVLQEFFVTITRKVSRPLPGAEARGLVDRLSNWALHSTDRADLLNAIEMSVRFRLSLWDALILQAALRLRCRTLWTEDFQDGQTFEFLTVRNPFAELPA